MSIKCQQMWGALIFALWGVTLPVHADVSCLQRAYPEHISTISSTELIWRDGSSLPMHDGKTGKSTQELLDNPSLFDQINGPVYQQGFFQDPDHFAPLTDPGRIRNEPFFKKMYGNTEAEVKAKLVTIYWMPRVFGFQYPLEVTTVNGVNVVFESLSAALEEWVTAHPYDIPFLDNPSGTFNWRTIANTNRLSMHSFGMTIDLTPELTEYWQWDLTQAGRPISEEQPLFYHNRLPWGIVKIFEAHGFIWGGKWAHYDTQHFEYRPELLC
jgi:peptidoglycan LD-endopeptidase CwlK